jgi:hypothetical protein
MDDVESTECIVVLPTGDERKVAYTLTNTQHPHFERIVVNGQEESGDPALDLDKTPAARGMSVLGRGVVLGDEDDEEWVRMDDNENHQTAFADLLVARWSSSTTHEHKKISNTNPTTSAQPLIKHVSVAFKVVRNTTHWSVVVVDVDIDINASWPEVDARVQSATITVVGSTEHAKNRPYDEIIAEWDSVFGTPVRSALRAFADTKREREREAEIPMVTVRYGQVLQYGNMGCMFAAHWTHNRIKQGMLALGDILIQPGDRVVEQRGWMVMQLDLASDEVSSYTVDSKQNQRLVEAQGVASGVEVLSIVPNEVVASYTSRSQRISRTQECELRITLFTLQHSITNT